MTETKNTLETSQEIELIIGNSNANFSGVTSTMLQVLPYQQKLMNLQILLEPIQKYPF